MQVVIVPITHAQQGIGIGPAPARSTEGMTTTATALQWY